MKKKICANLRRIIELFSKKIVIKLSKIWFGIRDPRTGIRELENPIWHPGSRGQNGTGPGSATLVKTNAFYILQRGKVWSISVQREPWSRQENRYNSIIHTLMRVTRRTPAVLGHLSSVGKKRPSKSRIQ